MKAKRLYRVFATYPDGHTWQRDYQSANAAKERRDRLVQGFPPADRVTIYMSDPVTWPSL